MRTGLRDQCWCTQMAAILGAPLAWPAGAEFKGPCMSPGCRWLWGMGCELQTDISGPGCRPGMSAMTNLQFIRKILFWPTKQGLCVVTFESLCIWRKRTPRGWLSMCTPTKPWAAFPPACGGRCHRNHQVEITCTVPAPDKGPPNCSQGWSSVSDLPRWRLTVSPNFLHGV